MEHPLTSPDTSTRATTNRGPWIALGSLVFGLIAGLLVVESRSADALRAVRWIEPVGTIWVNAIRMTVIPLIVASLIVAISGAGPGMARRLGLRSLVVFMILLSIAAMITVVAAPLMFEHLTIDQDAARLIRGSAAVVQSPELPSFSSWLVSLVPPNPIKAAADGAMLPLVVFTLAFGLALGSLDAAASGPVVDWFSGVAAASTVLVRWVLAVAPVGVFALAIGLATRLGGDVFGAVGFYLAAHSLLCVVMIAVLYIIILLTRRVPLRLFARAALPAQVVAASTRSSMAALPSMLTSAEATLGLSRPVTSFALPLAVSTLRLNQPVSWLVMALFAAKLYGVELSGATIATIAVTSVLMSFSVPGIPSGSLFVVAPFFVAAGIPAESVGVLIAVDLIPDFFKTLLNVTGHLTAVTLIGNRPES